MFVKIVTIALTALVATTAASVEWDGLVASWTLKPTGNYYTIPRELQAALDEGWTSISGVNQPEGQTALGYEGDPTLIILFEDGKAVGFQIAFPVSDVAGKEIPLDWPELPTVIEKTLDGKSYYTSTAYYSEDESTGKHELLFVQKDGLRKVPTTASEVAARTEFLPKSCFPGMGTHYYTWHTDADCATLNPWVFLARGDDIVGLAFQGFGTATQVGSRQYWETINAAGIYAVIPDPPMCAVEAAGEFGIITLHVWFVKDPRSITCV